jgi:cyclophilin family peptidyl-prolyl cis-trans isomerase
MNRFIYPILGSFFVFIASVAPANTLAIFRTSLGDMAFELFDTDKPRTVSTFIQLANLGFYTNRPVYRLEPGFVVQGGNISVADPASTNPAVSFSGNNLGLIPNEFAVGQRLSNTFGTLAMAKNAFNTNSAANTWFINLGDNSAVLDTQNGGFTVFGRIVQGADLLTALNTRSNGYGIVDLSGSNTPPLNAMPVAYTGTNLPRYDQLIYASIDILRTSLIPWPDQTRTVQWNSPTGLVCRIEASDSGPGSDGSWSLLHQTNGNGQLQSFLDTNTAAHTRIYRIRIAP